MSVDVSSNANNDDVNFVAPDGGWDWVVVVSSLVIHIIMDGITYASGIYLKVQIDDFDSWHTGLSVVFLV
jgi:hypothetical protein